MSAETLRRAAALIRGSWTDAADTAARMRADGSGVAVGTMAPTMLAVADLLDEIALRWEYVEERDLALAVARAYLGETP